MLVKRLAHQDSDRGSMLVSVLVVMLVLSIIVVTSSVLVASTTRSVVGTRSTLEAQAAADAGLADAVAAGMRSGSSVCTLSLTSASAPRYTAAAECPPGAGIVRFTSTGKGADGGVAKIQSVYEYSTTPVGHGADMVFYSDATFTAEVLTSLANGSLLSIVIPSGGFTCQVHVPGNIIASGNVKTNGNCTIDGSVVAGGTFTMTNSTDIVKGNAVASSTSAHTINGKVFGDLKIGGPLAGVGGSVFSFPGSVSVNGDVNLGSASISGSLTLPATSKLVYNGTTVLAPNSSPRVTGGITWASPGAPKAPQFEPWFEYAYKLADWQPYGGATFAERKLVNSGSGMWTCDRFNSWPNAGWTDLAALTAPTVVDASACSKLSSNNGGNPVVSLQTDVVLVAKNFNLTNLTMRSSGAAQKKVWFVTNDGDTTGAGKGKPSCSNGAGDMIINLTDTAGVLAMVYTPCVIDVGGNSKWSGSFYGGGFSYGGGMTFVGGNIALPGMPASATLPGAGVTTVSKIGSLLSRRDVP